jgi:hypothetical protein
VEKLPLKILRSIYTELLNTQARKTDFENIVKEASGEIDGGLASILALKTVWNIQKGYKGNIDGHQKEYGAAAVLKAQGYGVDSELISAFINGDKEAEKNFWKELKLQEKLASIKKADLISQNGEYEKLWMQ